MNQWVGGLAIWSRAALLLALSALFFSAKAQNKPAGSPTSAVSPELDLQDYSRELARISDVVKNRADLREVRSSLPATWTVRDGDRVYSVSTKEISDALRAMEHDPQKPPATELQVRLQFMQQQAVTLSGLSYTTDRQQAERKLKKILSRGEFQEASGPSAWELLRARINRWIFEHLIRLIRFMHISQKTGNTIAWGVLLLAVVLVFYVFYKWLTKTTKDGDFRAEVEPAASDAHHWIQEAFAAADRGDFREAIHCAYWAAVARLEDIRILPRDRARTPRESLRLVDEYPKEKGPLQNITRSFELSWYGYRPVSAADWAGAKEQLEKMGCLQGSIAPTVPS
jgi:hypothetical protein